MNDDRARSEVEGARGALSGLSRLVRRKAQAVDADPVADGFQAFLSAVDDGAAGVESGSRRALKPKSDTKPAREPASPSRQRSVAGANESGPSAAAGGERADEGPTAGDAFSGFAWD